MFKRLLFALAISLLAGSAYAACTPPLAVKDASGNSVSMSVVQGADGSCQYYIDVDSSSRLYQALTSKIPQGDQYIGQTGIEGKGSGATGGLSAGLKTCDLHATYDASDNGSKEMIAAVSGRTIYICGFILATGGTATNLKLVDGTGTDCATGTPTNLTPAYQLVANDKIGVHGAFWTGLKASGTNRAVCVNASAGNAHQAEIWYTIQ